MAKELNYEIVRVILKSATDKEPAQVVLESESLGYSRAELDLDRLRKVRDDAEQLQHRIIQLIMEQAASPNEPNLKQVQDLEQTFSRFGDELYRVLFTGDVRTKFDEFWASAVDGPADAIDGIRVRIEINPWEEDLLPVAGIPWELLNRSNQLVSDSLGHHRRATIIRYLENKRKQPRVEVQGPLRVLLAIAEPGGYEVQGDEQLVAALEQLHSDQKIARPTILRRATLPKIRAILRNERINVFHFLGHGGFNQSHEDGGLLMFDAEDETSRVEGARAMADVCKGLPDLALVILSSCQGAALSNSKRNPFLRMAPAILDAQVPAVVAMQYPISHKAAIYSSRALYEALTHFDPIDVAVGEARLALKHHPSTSFEWSSPVIFTRVDDCRIVVPPEVCRLGVVSFSDSWGEGMRERCEENVLDLSQHFIGPEFRKIRVTSKTIDGKWSPQLILETREFLNHIEQTLPIEFEFAAHNSFAFVIGRELEIKSGLDLSVRQRGANQSAKQGDANAPEPWTPQRGDVPEGPLWDFSEPPTPSASSDANVRDLAVAISITHDVQQDVVDFIAAGGLGIKNLLVATIRPEVGQGSVVSGAHVQRLAMDLATRVLREVKGKRPPTVHIFAAAPVAFMLYFGQQSRTFGEIQLYEHIFGAKDPHPYVPSFHLTLPSVDSFG